MATNYGPANNRDSKEAATTPTGVPTSPGIPEHLVTRPCAGGLVVPWITPVTSTGLYLFGKISHLAQVQCLLRRLCQVCGRRLATPAVLFARSNDLANGCTAEPALCVPCAAYSARACPMLSGRRAHYRAGEHPALAGIPVSIDQALRQGSPAGSWFAVWIRDYDVIPHPAEPDTLAASWQRILPLRIQPLTATA
ncbi:hypothetical protein HH310_42825 [Actinoplanes sp. TBRC 11911]|nr:hypothetical protein [Actinoplanes sp. TBRC 11911]